MATDNEYRFLYTADVHGNRYQTLSTLIKAFDLGLDAVVFGGDIAPKEGNKDDGSHWKLDHKTRHPEAQKQYYEDFMIPLFEEYTHSTSIDVYTMMSNDDFGINMEILEKSSNERKFKLLHGQAHKLPNGLFIVGESYVDLTSFVNKDWEKWDLSSCDAPIDSRTRLVGYSSTEEGFTNYCTPEGNFFNIDFRVIPPTNSLEAHLFNIIKPLSDPQKTVYVFHAPPYGTNIDQMKGKYYAGSRAVRKYFEQVGGILGLHGHIHETVDVSGHFLDKVGNTIVAAPGNDPFNHPTDYYRNYSRTLHALIVSVSETNLNVDRVAVEFGKIKNKIPQIILKYARGLK